MNVEVGDKVWMADLRTGLTHNVTVTEIYKNGQVIVESERSPHVKWITDESLLSPRKQVVS